MNAPHNRTIRRPRIALAMGDPAGISPELTARLLADRDVTSAGQILVVGDGRVLAEGARVAQVALDVDHVGANGLTPDEVAGLYTAMRSALKEAVARSAGLAAGEGEERDDLGHPGRGRGACRGGRARRGGRRS